MRNYTILLSDDVARALMENPGAFEPIGSELPLDQKQIEHRAAWVVARAMTRPEKPDPIPERAMTLLRDVAMQRAIAAAEPGENGLDTERRAKQMLEWVLGE